LREAVLYEFQERRFVFQDQVLGSFFLFDRLKDKFGLEMLDLVVVIQFAFLLGIIQIFSKVKFEFFSFVPLKNIKFRC
jgi:hypothetical protein